MSEILVNGAPRSLADPALAGLLEELGIDPSRGGIAVALNDELLPRARWEGVSLRPGDRVEIVGARQGG